MNKMPQEQEPSTRVILVCIQNKQNKILTHDKFFKYFSPYGTIQRILIFERQVIWKIFIEFDNNESAKQAFKDLNNQNFYDDQSLKITIYGSQLETINFQENNPAGVDYTILRKKINEKQKKVTLSNSPLSTGNQRDNNSSQAITPTQYNNQSSYDQMLMNYSGLNDSQEQAQFSQLNNKNFFIMQNSVKLEFMRQQLNFQQQLQQNLENIQSTTMLLQQLSFEQQSLSYMQDFSQSAKANQLIQKNFEILKDLQDQHQFATNLISQYHKYLINSQFYRQQLEIQQPQQQQGQIQFLKSIEEPQMSQNTKPAFKSQSNTPQQPFQKNSKNNTPVMNKTKQSQTPSAKPRFVNTKKQTNNNGELYEDVSKDTEIGEYVNPLFLKVTRKCKVLYGRWFDRKIVSLRMLYNMFSLYGNIEKMIYFKEKSGCLVQYFSVENAELAKESLTDVVLYGQVLKIFYSNYEEIVLKQIYQGEQQFNQDSSNNEEYFLGNEETFRYKNNQVAVAPCDTLLVMNLSDELVEDEQLVSYFQKFGPPINNRKKLDSNDQHQCLLQFQSTEIALKYLVHMHNISLNGRKIMITFSNERL